MSYSEIVYDLNHKNWNNIVNIGAQLIKEKYGHVKYNILSASEYNNKYIINFTITIDNIIYYNTFELSLNNHKKYKSQYLYKDNKFPHDQKQQAQLLQKHY